MFGENLTTRKEQSQLKDAQREDEAALASGAKISELTTQGSGPIPRL